MILNNLQLINSDKVIAIKISGKYIEEVSKIGTFKPARSINLNFENAVVLPGLINSHDHLDFNLFPQLGNDVYNNYTEWASLIHNNYKDEITAVQQVPEQLRVQWGIYKNLLCGVTTVVNHGKKLANTGDLITVIQTSQSLHSVAFEKRLKWRLNNPFNLNKAVTVHVGEGTDEFAANEIDKLVKWNLLRRKLVAVHGVCMSIEKVQKFKALVWCPASNYFLLNETANVDQLKDHTTICFGSDSTLTSDWNIWEHFRLATEHRRITSIELLQMLTTNAAKVWSLNKGEITEGKDADIIVTKKRNIGSVFDTNPEDILLVIHEGEICLFDDCLSGQLYERAFENVRFSTVQINNSIKYVKGNLEQLIIDIQHHYPAAQLPCKPIEQTVTQ